MSICLPLSFCLTTHSLLTACFVLCHRIPHQFIAEMMAFTFTQITERLNNKLPLIQKSIPNFPPKPLFFTDVTSKTMCFPALKSFSTLDDSTESITSAVAQNSHPFPSFFAPYACSKRTKWCKYRKRNKKTGEAAEDHLYYRGWSFKQDRPG